MATKAEAKVMLREMRQDDMGAAYALSSEQSWPHRPEDWAFMLQVGRGLVAEVDHEVVGTIMGWTFGDHVATLGMVIVARKAQGMGIGRKLMNAMLELLGDRSIILNSTEEGFPLYRSLGFEVEGVVCQHQGNSFAVPLAPLLPNERIRPMGSNDHAVLGALYSQSMDMDRNALFAGLVRNAKSVVLSRNEEPAGFAMLRRFGRGHSIGPIVAPDLAGARTLASHWLSTRMGQFCRLDVTEDGGLSQWLEQIGLPCVGRVTRMVRGQPPRPDGAYKVYSLVSQALG